MANPLSSPALWKSWDNTTPPFEWNGTAYDFLDPSSAQEHASLTYTGTFPTPSFQFTALMTEIYSDFENGVRVIVDGTPTDYTLTLNTPLVITVPNAASSLVIEGNSEPAAGRLYAAVSLTPVAATAPATCDEMGRVSRAYVSAYIRDRQHLSRLIRGEKRCLIANFNGAIPTVHSISSVTFFCSAPWQVAMDTARIMPDLRGTGVNITAILSGGCLIKCVATLENGEAYVQLFRINIQESPWYQGEIIPPSGPYVLTAAA